jgi:hypothetical protein
MNRLQRLRYHVCYARGRAGRPLFPADSRTSATRAWGPAERASREGKEKGERQGAEGGGGTRRSPWPPAARSDRELVAVHARTPLPRHSESRSPSMLASADAAVRSK